MAYVYNKSRKAYVKVKRSARGARNRGVAQKKAPSHKKVGRGAKNGSMAHKSSGGGDFCISLITLAVVGWFGWSVYTASQPTSYPTSLIGALNKLSEDATRPTTKAETLAWLFADDKQNDPLFRCPGGRRRC